MDVAVVIRMPEHGAEAARVMQAQHLGLRAVVHDQVEVVVLFRFDPGRQHAQVAGHAEVNNQLAGIKADQQVFAAPAHLRDALADQGCGQVGGEGPAQAFAPEHDLFDDAAFQMRCHTAPGHFYFGEFRHENLTKFV